MIPMNISTQDTPKIAGNSRTTSRTDAKGQRPESQKAAVTVTDNSDVKHPPRRLKSTTLRRKARSDVERIVGKSSASEIKEYARSRLGQSLDSLLTDSTQQFLQFPDVIAGGADIGVHVCDPNVAVRPARP